MRMDAGESKQVSVEDATGLMEEEVLEAENILFIGWRRDLEDMLHELDNWVAPIRYPISLFPS